MQKTRQESKKVIMEQERRVYERAQQLPEPHKCPRCDSLNTKFCYYNNYSLSQPRYFCKTCRRYWTQGGTLRNVPVGGGCRKGKRPRNSLSSRSSQIQPQRLVAASLSPPVPSFYQDGGGYLASLQAQFNQHHFDQSLNLNVAGGGSSNMGLLQSFNAAAAASSIASQQHQICPAPPQFYQMGTSSTTNGGMEVMSSSVYNNNTSQQGLNLIPSNMANTAAASATTHHHWPVESFMNTNNSDALSTLWRNISTTRSLAGSTALLPNQWTDLQGLNHHQAFHPHPPPQ